MKTDHFHDQTAMTKLTHFDDQGRSRMVDVGEKQITTRIARASGKVRMLAETLMAAGQRPSASQTA